MNYSTIIYCLSILTSIYAVSGINFNNFFKVNKKYEANIFVFMISIALGYLVASFIITLLEVSKVV